MSTGQLADFTHFLNKQMLRIDKNTDVWTKTKQLQAEIKAEYKKRLEND